jgi:hypothetical protein
VPYQGSVLGRHIVLNYIDSNGVHHTLQGVTGAPAVPLVSSDDANFSGGLLGRFASLAGTDPNQPAPPDDEQEQANLQALEDRLSSTGNINDAWALYNARTASRR